MTIVKCETCGSAYDGTHFSSSCPHTDPPGVVKIGGDLPATTAAIVLATVQNEAVNAMLDWGQALNAMINCEDPVEKKKLEVLARSAGSTVQSIAIAIAKLLRPNGSEKHVL